MIEEFKNKFSDYTKDLFYHGVRVPKIGIDNELEFLTNLCREGYKDKKIAKKKNSKEYAERIKKELEILEKLGFTRYILLVWDLTNWARSRDIPLGDGRGSAAGSLVLYLIGVTGLDPIEYGLFFERFVNESRAKSKYVDGELYLDGSLIADIDIDISYKRRSEIIEEYLQVKFKEQTCKILTLTSFSSKLCIKETAKTFSDKTETEMNAVTKTIETAFGTPYSIDVCLNGDQSKDIKPNHKFCEWAEQNEDTILIAKKIEGLVKNYGVHASGYILSYDKLLYEMPYMKAKDGSLVSAFDMKSALDISVKLDLLGLKTLDIVDETMKDVGLKHEDIDINDEKVYEFLSSVDDNYGIFQIEGYTGTRVTKKVKPRNIHDVSAILALARPGALQFVDQYSEFVETGEAKSLHEKLDVILEKTAGTMLYQEQVMAIGNQVFGFSLAETELLRRAIGKKIKTEIDKWKERIQEKVENGVVTQELADIYWKVVEDSAGYSFNASHSYAYSMLTYKTAYLKYYYTKYFLKNCLKMTNHEAKPQQAVSSIIKEARNFNIPIFPPSLIKSKEDFEIEGDGIRCGLGNLKSVSDKSLDKIKEFTLEGDFNKFQIFEAASQSKINITILSNLIRSGCLDEFIESTKDRELLVFEAKCWNALTNREKGVLMSEEFNKYNCNLVSIFKEAKQSSTYLGIFKKESRWDNFNKAIQSAKEDYVNSKNNIAFKNYYNEYNVLGFAFSENLLDLTKEKWEEAVCIEDVLEGGEGYYVFGAVVVESVEKKSKNGNKYLRIIFSDETGEITAMAFSGNDKEGKWAKEDQIQVIKDSNKGILPISGNLVIVKAHKKDSGYTNIENLRIFI